MSWNFSGIIAKSELVKSQKQFLAFFYEQRLDIQGEITMMDATSDDFQDIGVAVWNRYLMIFDKSIGYVCGFDSSKLSQFDKLMVSKSGMTDILAYHLDGRSSTYGYCFYQDRLRKRCRSVHEEQVIYQEGRILSFEPGIDLHEEDRIIGMISNFLDAPFFDVLFKENIMVQSFKRVNL